MRTCQLFCEGFFIAPSASSLLCVLVFGMCLCAYARMRMHACVPLCGDAHVVRRCPWGAFAWCDGSEHQVTVHKHGLLYPHELRYVECNDYQALRAERARLAVLVIQRAFRWYVACRGGKGLRWGRG